MSILDKDTIISCIIPYLTVGKKGPQRSENKLVSTVELIIYRLKTGCQWRELPIKQFMDEHYSWKTVFHYFNQWSKNGCWQNAWERFASDNKQLFDLSSAQLDGTHTPSKRGGEAVAYQGRKACKTTNTLCICDSRGIPVAASRPESGNQHDLFDIEKHFSELIQMLEKQNITVDGLFLNADAGFDSAEFREICFKHGVIPNFCLNPRNGRVSDREDYFDDKLYKHRTVVEHLFAWMDAYKALLVRFETTARNWFSLQMLAFLVIFARKTTPIVT